jgi:hypothetical protein
MPGFIQDMSIRNLVIKDEALQQLRAIIDERVKAHNAPLQANDEQSLVPIYTVRFDNRGYRTFDVAEAWTYYTSADKVERVVVQADSIASISSARERGSFIEVRLDIEGMGSHIQVGGVSKDWVEAGFGALSEWSARHKDLPTTVIRTGLTPLLIQLAGLGAMVLVSLWLAAILGVHLQGVEYPRVIAFALAFLVLSNIWTYAQPVLLRAVLRTFPNVRFSRKGEHLGQWLLRKLIEAVGIAFAFWVLGLGVKWATAVVAPMLSAG